MEIGQRFNPYETFVGAFIPNVLMRYPNVSASAKLVWARLSQYAGKNGEIFPKQEVLAEEVGISKRHVQTILYELRDNGFLEIENQKVVDRLSHKSNRYFILWHEIFNLCVCRDEQKCVSGNDENFASKERESVLRESEFKNVSKETYTLSAKAGENDLNNVVIQPVATTQPTLKLNRKIKPLVTKKEKPIPKVPEDVQKIINFWNSLGLRQHSNPNAKIYLEIVKMLKKLMSAKFFESTSPYAIYAGTEFTPKQIMDSIHQFSFAALNFNYKPQGSFKETLKKTSLQDFLYNNRVDKSFFIEYHENEAKLLADSDKMVDDPDPEQTMILKDVWVKQILKGVAPNSWSVFQERDFRKCSKEIGVWFGNNGKKIGNYWNVNGDTVMHKRKRAELLMSCLLSSVNEDVTKLTVSHLAYPSTFNEKFPKYLNQQGVLE